MADTTTTEERNAKRQKLEKHSDKYDGDVNEILEKHYVEPEPKERSYNRRHYAVRSYNQRPTVELPKSYSTSGEETVTLSGRSSDPLSLIWFEYFLLEVGWIATHLMFHPYTGGVQTHHRRDDSPIIGNHAPSQTLGPDK